MDDIKEEWRPIEGYEGLYEVSNLGRVKSLKREVRFGHTFRVIKSYILKPQKSKDGYFIVSLSQKTHKVHRLVAKAFLPNPDNLPQVNHKDECKTNNFISLTNPEDSNLEWCDCKYNINYGTHNERSTEHLINHPSMSKPVLCVELNTIYPSTMEAKRQLGVPQQSISKCCLGRKRYKTAGGYHWKFV